MPVVPPVPGSLDIITLAEAKNAINWTGSTSRDAEMALLVTAVSDQIDALCGPVVRRTVTGEMHDGTLTVLFLRVRPVWAVSTITEYTPTLGTVLAAETNTVATTNDYLFDPDKGSLIRRANHGDGRFVRGRRNITIDYVAGRFADTASCSPRFKNAAKMLFAHLWRSEQGAGSQQFGPGEQVSYGTGPGFLIPNRVRQALAREILEPGMA